MKISKKKWEAMKASKAGRRVAAAAKGGGGTVLQTGTGAVLAYVEGYLDRIQMVRDNPYGKGLALALIGHIAKRNAKARPYAGGACVLGGFMLGQAFRNRDASAPAASSSAPALPSVDTQGLETGAVLQLVPRQDTGAVLNLNRTSLHNVAI